VTGVGGMGRMIGPFEWMVRGNVGLVLGGFSCSGGILESWLAEPTEQTPVGF